MGLCSNKELSLQGSLKHQRQKKATSAPHGVPKAGKRRKANHVPGSLSEQQRNEYTRFQGDPDDYCLMNLVQGNEASDQAVCPIVFRVCN